MLLIPRAYLHPQSGSSANVFSLHISAVTKLLTLAAAVAVFGRLLGILAAQQAAGVTILLACDSPAAFSSITRTVYAIEEGTLHLQGQ